ncbi:MAG: amidophosphoribosyltransferase [Candidatus Lokiarchaeota archaeon]|nr:amidophosphoribosyltransferase [Candidatus Lokiarchaeota archaeon]
MCGIFGMCCNNFLHSVAGTIYTGLMALQHRGQRSCGISTTQCDGKIVAFKDKGLVSRVLNLKVLSSFSGNVGIGHVGDNTLKSAHQNYLQPFHHESQNIEFSIVMDGAVTNYKELREDLETLGIIFSGNTHVELISALIELLYKIYNKDILLTLIKTVEALKGAFSVLLMTSGGELFAFRDPVGYTPLCHGVLETPGKSIRLVASESSALDVLGCQDIFDVKPGEVVEIHPNKKVRKHRAVPQKNGGICHFEFVNNARPDSVIEGLPVANIRYKLGRNLAKLDIINFDNAIVVPIPDSGRSAAMGYSWESGILYQEGLMKNRYRWKINCEIKEKLNPIKAVIEGKDIVLIDDSILSGNTLKEIILMLRTAGANSVHVRISCPPIINKCETNGSLKSRDLLIASKTKIDHYDNFNEEMRTYIGADTLVYQSIECFIDAVGLDENNMCLSCIAEYCLVKEEERLNHLEIDLIVK